MDTDENPDRYPGYERDLNTGAPITLNDVVMAVKRGVDNSYHQGYAQTGPGQLGLEHGRREVFASARGHGARTYWVTGVRLIADESGSSSLAGAIELILEDGDHAQSRAATAELSKKAVAVAEFLAVRLAHIARGGPQVSSTGMTNDQIEAFVPMARHILREHGADLDLPHELGDYL